LPADYVNADAGGVMHFPGYGADAARLLVERGVVGIGIDTLSLDHGPSQNFAPHKIMLAVGKYQIENMANLDALPARGGSQAQARVPAPLP
jgi:kynurenine formamidase